MAFNSSTNSEYISKYNFSPEPPLKKYVLPTLNEYFMTGNKEPLSAEKTLSFDKTINTN